MAPSLSTLRDIEEDILDIYPASWHQREQLRECSNTLALRAQDTRTTPPRATANYNRPSNNDSSSDDNPTQASGRRTLKFDAEDLKPSTHEYGGKPGQYTRKIYHTGPRCLKGLSDYLTTPSHGVGGYWPPK